MKGAILMGIRCGYLVGDDSPIFDTYFEAWEYERKKNFPNLILLNREGNKVENIIAADSFILSSWEEGDFLEEYIVEERYKGIIWPRVKTRGAWVHKECDGFGEEYYDGWEYDMIMKNKFCQKKIINLYEPGAFIRNYYKL